MAHSQTRVTPRLLTPVADATISEAVLATEYELRTRHKTRFVAEIAANSPCIPRLTEVYDKKARNPYQNPTHKVELEEKIPELGVTVIAASRSRLVAQWLDVTVMINPTGEEAEENQTPRFAYYTIRLNTLKVYEAAV